MNKNSQNVRIPLKGLAIGDGLCDPIHQMDYGDFLFQTGFVDENDRNVLQNMSQTTREYINSKLWQNATNVRFFIVNTNSCTNFNVDYNFLFLRIFLNYTA